jgi:2-alkyl-3-oxoalkanoate reductase
MARVALTGATGFVGRRVLSLLLESGHSVRALARSEGALPRHAALEQVTGTLADDRALETLVRDSQAVIHVAGATSGMNYQDFAEANVAGCERLLRAIASHAPETRLVHVSSLAAREPHLSEYAASKRAGEDCIRAVDSHWLIVRPPAVYGPDDPALAPLWRMLARGWLPYFGPVDARFSLLHVDDLANALVTAAATGWPEATTITLHDGHPQGYGWAEIGEIASRLRNGRVRRVRIPISLLHALGWTNRTVARVRGTRPPVLVTGKISELVHPDWVCDNTDLPGCPDWRPVRTLANSLNSLPGWKKFQ